MEREEGGKQETVQTLAVNRERGRGVHCALAVRIKNDTPPSTSCAACRDICPAPVPVPVPASEAPRTFRRPFVCLCLEVGATERSVCRECLDLLSQQVRVGQDRGIGIDARDVDIDSQRLEIFAKALEVKRVPFCQEPGNEQHRDPVKATIDPSRRAPKRVDDVPTP